MARRKKDFSVGEAGNFNISDEQERKQLMGNVSTMKDLVPGRCISQRWMQAARMLSVGTPEREVREAMSLGKHEWATMRKDPRFQVTLARYSKDMDEKLKEVRDELATVSLHVPRVIEKELMREPDDPHYSPDRQINTAFRLAEMLGIEVPKVIQQEIRTTSLSAEKKEVFLQVMQEAGITPVTVEAEVTDATD